MRARRVLIADDDRDTTETMSLLLSMEGYEVRCAQDGKSAMQLYREFQPDAVFLDISMPLLDGHEVARRIRALADRPGVILVAISGWAQGSDIRESLECGFDHHFSKPVEFERVARVIPK